MIDIKPLRYFVTLAETRHFGHAAAKLNLSQPPLSRQLAALEHSVGVKLVERSPRSVTLTAAGERFYADAKAILDALARAEQNARDAAEGTAGRLAIGFTMCAAYSVVPRYARRFRDAHPRVELVLREVVSNDLAASVLGGRVDAAIMLAEPLHPALASRTVFSEPLCVALPAKHPLAHSKRIGAKKLSGEPFVIASESVAPSLRAAIVGYCRAAGFEPAIGYEVQLQQTVLSLVAEGAGIALVPASMRSMQPAGVVFRPLAEAPTIDQILVWSPQNGNPCVARFLDLI